MHKEEALINKQESKNEALFNKQYYQDITQRTDMQNMFRLLQENQRNAEERSAAQAAVLGTTAEQQLAEKEGIRKSYADAMADLASNASSLRDAYMENYMNRADNIFKEKLNMQDKIAGIYQNESAQMSQASQNLFSSAMKFAGGAVGQAAGAQGATGGDYAKGMIDAYKGMMYTSPIK